MSSTVEELKARLEEAKRRRLAELAAKTAAQAAAAPHVSDAAPPPTTVVHQVSPSSEPAPVEMKPTTVGVPQTATSRPQTPAPVLVPPPLEVNDGKEAPDFSRRSRRGNPPSVLRDPAAVPRVTAAKLLLAAVKPSLRGVTPVPPPPEFPTLQRPKRGARDDSLGRASSLSGDESDTAVDGKRRLTDVSALPSEPPKAAHRSEQGQQVAAEALPSKVSIGPLRRLPPDLDGAMKENELPRQRNTRSAAEFNRNRRISEGVYGVVYEGTEIATKKHYALKWIKDRWFIESKVGFPDYLLREIDLMARLRHPNIVSHVCMATCPNLHPTDMSTINNGDGASSDGNIKLVSLPTPLSASPRVPPSDALHTKLFLVAEYAGATLRNEIYRTNEPLNLASIKWLLCQLLRGIRFMHTHHILHRDLKPSNVLVDDEATVKVCDMGLARVVRPVDANLTTTVITLMYRPPELHFGVRTYEASVDMWSIGCIAAEMVLRQPLFPCSEDNEHLQKICEVLGAPTNEAIFPGMMQFSQASEGLSKVRVPPEAAKAPECYSVPIGATSTTFISCLRLRRALLAARPDINTSDGLALIDLIDRLIQWSPRARLTAAEALEHPFFTKGDDASAVQIKARRDAYFAEKAKHRAEASAIKAARAASVAKMEGVPLTTAADETPAKASDDDEVDNAAEGVAPKDVGVHHVAHDEDAVA